MALNNPMNVNKFPPPPPPPPGQRMNPQMNNPMAYKNPMMSGNPYNQSQNPSEGQQSNFQPGQQYDSYHYHKRQ